VDRAKLGWASFAAAVGARVCSELPEDSPPDHAWSSRGCGREGVGFAGYRCGPTVRSQPVLAAVVAGNGPFPAAVCSAGTRVLAW
jgi:hypothetical protein